MDGKRRARLSPWMVGLGLFLGDLDGYAQHRAPGNFRVGAAGSVHSTVDLNRSTRWQRARPSAPTRPPGRIILQVGPHQNALTL